MLNVVSKGQNTIKVLHIKSKPGHTMPISTANRSDKCEWLSSFLTRPAVLQSHQGHKVLAVVAKEDGVSVAFLGRPMEGQVNPAHFQRSEIWTRFQTSQHFVCFRKKTERESLQWTGTNIRSDTVPCNYGTWGFFLRAKGLQLNSIGWKERVSPATTMTGLLRMLQRTKMCISSREWYWSPPRAPGVSVDAILTRLSHSSVQF